LIPCIDLQGGQAVQLVHGRKRELAVADVFGQLEKFKKYPWLHVIDLNAAMGKGANDELVQGLCLKARKDFGMKVRVGGGIRSISRALEVAAWGATQIIVGSAAFRGEKVNKDFLEQLVRNIPCEKIVIALDTARGKIAIQRRHLSGQQNADATPGAALAPISTSGGVDSVTGLHTRAFIEQQLGKEIARARRQNTALS